ncbi:MAG: hypothetical protein ACRDY2_04590 [Acidimicrobiales bacterium]
MSGPKCCHYEVVSAEELERRALEQAKAAWCAYLSKRGTFMAVVEAARSHYGEGISAIGDITADVLHTSEEYRRALHQEVVRLEMAETRFRTEVADARARAMVAAVGGLGVSERVQVRSAGDALAKYRGGGQRQAASAAERREAVGRALRRLDGDADSARVAAIQRLAEQVLANGNDGRATTELVVLQDDIQVANREAMERRQADREIAALDVELAGVGGVEVSRLRARLADDLRDHARPGEELRAAVAEAVRAGKVNADRRFATAVAVACLGELGYDVEPGFETRVADGGVLHATNTHAAGYGVQIRALPGGSLGFHVVRSQSVAADAVREKEVEEEWCSDFAGLCRAAKGRGVDFALTRVEPPGSLPIPAVNVPALSRSKRNRAGREPAAAEMEKQ